MRPIPRPPPYQSGQTDSTVVLVSACLTTPLQAPEGQQIGCNPQANDGAGDKGERVHSMVPRSTPVPISVGERSEIVPKIRVSDPSPYHVAGRSTRVGPQRHCPFHPVAPPDWQYRHPAP